MIAAAKVLLFPDCTKIFRRFLFKLLLRQCLTNVGEDVVNIFDTDGEADEVGRDTCLAQLLVGELAMGVRSGMKHAGASSAAHPHG